MNLHKYSQSSNGELIFNYWTVKVQHTLIILIYYNNILGWVNVAQLYVS